MWMVLWVTLALASPECPRFFCAPLNSTTCATITDVEEQVVQLNSLSCGAFTGCDIEEIYSALGNNQQKSFPCTFFPPETFIYGEDLSECPQKQSQKNLKYGLHPKYCNSAEDCELEDGSLGDCVCGVSRYKICQPHISDAMYSNFWKICGENNNKVTEQIDYIWGYYYWNFPLLVTAPICADDIIPQLWMKVLVHAEMLAFMVVMLLV
jgi:hypothetical protein